MPQNVNPTLLPIGSFTVTCRAERTLCAGRDCTCFMAPRWATTVVSPTQLTATGTSTQAQKGTVPITVQNPDPGKVTSSAFLNVQVGASGKVQRDR